jgi:hypothetical protein
MTVTEYARFVRRTMRLRPEGKVPLEVGAGTMKGVTAMDDILRFPSAVKHDPAIDAWLLAQRDELRPFVETWFERMRRCGADVRELMHDGCPTVCVGDAASAT